MKKEDVAVVVMLILGLILLTGGCVYCALKVASAFNFYLPIGPD